jgi:hypothetical protein
VEEVEEVEEVAVVVGAGEAEARLQLILLDDQRVRKNSIAMSVPPFYLADLPD